MIPTISAIQRTNAILVTSAVSLLGIFFSIPSALGCLLGGGVVIANLYLMSLLGTMVLAAANGGSMAHRAGMLAFPLKLLLIVALIYLAFSRAGIDGLGFGLGVLTQLLAILIETGRAAMRSRAAEA